MTGQRSVSRTATLSSSPLPRQRVSLRSIQTEVRQEPATLAPVMIVFLATQALTKLTPAIEAAMLTTPATLTRLTRPPRTIFGVLFLLPMRRKLDQSSRTRILRVARPNHQRRSSEIPCQNRYYQFPTRLMMLKRPLEDDCPWSRWKRKWPRHERKIQREIRWKFWRR